MKNLIYLIMLITILNCVQLIQSDELLELSCLNETECMQFQRSGIKSSCIEEQCQCTTSNGETVKCQPLNPNMSNIIGGACPCNQPNADCNRQENICYCVSDYIPSRDKRRCIAKMLSLGEKCEQDSQCQKLDFNAICHDSKECRCIDQFINYEGKCASMIGSKSASLNDSQCHEQYGANTMYSNTSQHCICVAGYFASAHNSRCLKIRKYLEDCTENTQCIGTMGLGGKCLGNICQCSEKYFVEEKKTQKGEMRAVCTAVVERGHYCRSLEDCYQRQLNETEQSMDCIYGECDCKKGFNAYNERDCVKSGGARFTSFVGLQSLFVLLVFANKYFS